LNTAVALFTPLSSRISFPCHSSLKAKFHNSILSQTESERKQYYRTYRQIVAYIIFYGVMIMADDDKAGKAVVVNIFDEHGGEDFKGLFTAALTNYFKGKLRVARGQKQTAADIANRSRHCGLDPQSPTTSSLNPSGQTLGHKTGMTGKSRALALQASGFYLASSFFFSLASSTQSPCPTVVA